MALSIHPRLVAVNRLTGGVVLRFADGRCAFFSAALLYSMLARADDLDETVTLW